ncbi:MAG: 6-carboxytetrahydropterin synthase [Gemmatimonadota bacterium]
MGFTARHRYWRPEWSDEENADRFGPWADLAEHSHGYRCEVTVEGEIDPGTGMAVNLQLLDELLERAVRAPLDGALLNEVAEFRGPCAVPTTENIARVVWARVVGTIPGCRLVEVRVHEDADLWATYRGE